MKKLSKDKLVGVVGTILVHALVLALLYLLVLHAPEKKPDSGLEVMLGVDIENVAKAQNIEAPQLVPEPQVAKPVPPAAEEPLITQDQEESLMLPPEEPKKEKLKKEEPKKVEKTPEQIKKEKEEAEKRERERKEAEAKEKANNSIFNAFNKGNKMNKKESHEQGEKAAGSPQGNSDKGQTSGVGVSFSLDGREPGGEGLIRPSYNVQESGRVVVDIIVSPAGKVVEATVNRKKSNTIDLFLNNAALKAARSTIFNSIDGVDNQRGTITYNFELVK